ncbi:hypothetical protein FF1_039115 [Malus domestica]
MALSAAFYTSSQPSLRASTTLENYSKLPVGEKSSLPSEVSYRKFEIVLFLCYYFVDLHMENDFVVFGGGHAATLTIRALKRGAVKPKAIAAVALTWVGPLPIVFGRDSSMQTRYGLLQGTLQAPAVGWKMYNMLVSNEKYALTKPKGARYTPAAFLTGLLDPIPVIVLSTEGSPKRSKAEIEALREADTICRCLVFSEQKNAK